MKQAQQEHRTWWCKNVELPSNIPFFEIWVLWGLFIKIDIGPRTKNRCFHAVPSRFYTFYYLDHNSSAKFLSQFKPGPSGLKCDASVVAKIKADGARAGQLISAEKLCSLCGVVGGPTNYFVTQTWVEVEFGCDNNF